MKLGIISDLHASLVPLEAVLADGARVGVERFICLGDLMDLGPQPVALLRRVQALGIPCLRGNHDALDGPALAPAPVNAWCREQLDAPSRAFLDGLPAELELELPSGDRLLCVHGSPRGFNDELLSATPDALLDAWLGERDFTVLAAGHTHLQMLRRHRGRTLFNPGSVAQPFLHPPDGGQPPVVLPHAEYAVLDCRVDGFSVDFRKVPYDFAAYARDVRASGLPGPDAWLATWAARRT